MWVHKGHVTHSVLLEVPPGSKEHIENTDAERQKASKTLPAIHTPSSDTGYFFFCSSYADVKMWSKFYPNNCPNELPQSRACDCDHLRTLAHSNSHTKQGGKLKAEKSRSSSWCIFRTCTISYGISQDLWREDGTSGWQNSADRLSPQSSLSWCLMSHKNGSKVSKKHEIKASKPVKVWWKMQAPTTVFSTGFLSGENCHEKTTSFPFHATKSLSDTLPPSITK